jgi:hypothetical protein
LPKPSASGSKADLPTFFGIWADERGWDVPDVHWLAVHWLEHRRDLAVLRCFRGFGKSTLLAIYNAWRYYQDRTYRILHQGDQDKTAFKTSRDTKAVLMRHPLTRQKFANIRGEGAFWWVPGADDERNPSMQAAGITSNITSSRCDEAQNDDVEVPRNIQNPEAREKMRYRLGEQTHCMVPGARQLYIGTPHTHDSLYDEQERMGADCLTIKMFAHEQRIDDAGAKTYELTFAPEMVFAGIGAKSRALKRGDDYQLAGKTISFSRPPGGLVDLYAGSAWPERFTPDEMVKRRRKCKTINEWDSQYQLHSRPVHEQRLNPDKIREYAVEPVLRRANGETAMWLGQVRIVGAACRWDPSSGKIMSDASTLALVLQDEQGRRYWHRAIEMRGEVAEFDGDGKTITGGQVLRIVEVVKLFSLMRVSVETNGIGGFGPAVLKAALKQAKLPCGVTEITSSSAKNKRILEAIEPPLSSGALWAHSSVLDGPAWAEMRDWNPAISVQPDDHIDALAGAITEAPERIGKVSAGWIAPLPLRDDWRPSTGVHEVELESDSIVVAPAH